MKPKMPNLHTKIYVSNRPNAPSIVLVTISVFCLPSPFSAVLETCESPKKITDGISITINRPAIGCLKNLMANHGANSNSNSENAQVIKREMKNA